MRFWGLVCAVIATLTTVNDCQAGLHLGMKLACKRYGDAWNSGSLGALRGVSTGDLYQQFARMPRDMFAQLPRGGSARVLSTNKGRGSGTVTVSTSSGIMTFVVVGGGFNWTVADIYRKGDDGRTVSTKEYLDVTLTASEFMEDLKYQGRNTFHDSITQQFRNSFHQLSKEELVRIRSFLPEITRSKPFIRMHGHSATMQVALPGGSRDDKIVFNLRRERGWRVDDYSVHSSTIEIPSFRNSLPLLACVTAFSEFTKSPTAIDPCCFTCEGKLRDALCYAQSQTPCPLTAEGKRTRFVVSKDCRSVEVCQGSKTLKMQVAADGNGLALSDVHVKIGDGWTDVADLIGIQQKVQESGVFAAFASMISSGSEKPAAIFANAVETQPSIPVDEEVVVESIAAVEKPAQVAKPVSATTSRPSSSRTYYVQPVTYYTTSRPVMNRRDYRQWKRSQRRCRRW